MKITETKMAEPTPEELQYLSVCSIDDEYKALTSYATYNTEWIKNTNPTVYTLKQGDNNKDMEKFLKIKKEQELKEQEEKNKIACQELKEIDDIVQIMKDTENRIKSILNIKENEDFGFPTYDYYTKETKEKIDAIYKQTAEEKNNIEKKYEEIESLCEGANWEERIKIYKMYKLIEE